MVGGANSNCPCSLWIPSQGPSGAPQDDPSPVELGTAFTSDINGFITGIRFFKSSLDAGPHTGTLWTASGTKLATASFTNESASGWQQASLNSPVAISANSVYVVSYHTDSGNYYADDGYFAQGVNNYPLHAPQDGTTASNGIYQYGSSAFPTSTFGVIELLGGRGLRHVSSAGHNASTRDRCGARRERDQCCRDGFGDGELQ